MKRAFLLALLFAALPAGFVPAQPADPPDVPAMSIRGVARILTAEPGGKLSDWFLSDDFWTTQLDLMKESGLNFLEIRGVYQFENGEYKNLFPYFVVHPEEEYAHRPDEEVAANMEMLRKVVKMAAGRGIETAVVNAGMDVEPADLVNPIGLVTTIVDPVIDFDWKGDGPVEGFERDHFAIRWTGFITPPETGEYTFFTVGEDGARLWVDGKKLIHDWGGMHGVLENSGKIALEAGKRYPIRLDYHEIMYAAVMHFEWQPPGGEREVVPSDVLEPARGSGHGLTGEYFTKRRIAREINAWSAKELAERCPGISLLGYDAHEDAKALEDADRIYPPVLDATKGVSLLRHAGTTDSRTLNELWDRYPGRVLGLADWNGDQLGLPYPALRDDDATRRCLRDPADRQWYLVWRLGGATNRVFPWLDPRFIQLCCRTMDSFNAIGFIWEPIGCYGPQRCDRIYRKPEGGEIPWTWLHQRDAATYAAWGVYGRNPISGKEEEIRAAFASTFPGSEEEIDDLYKPLTCLSECLELVPANQFLSATLDGYAPGFETGNDGRTIDWFMHLPTMDPMLLEPIRGSSRRHTGGHSHFTFCTVLCDLNEPQADSAPAVHLLHRDLTALNALIEFKIAYHEAAALLADYYRYGDPHHLSDAEKRLERAISFWTELIELTSEQFEPLVAPSRMRSLEFTWKGGLRSLEADRKRMRELRAELDGVSGLVIRHKPDVEAEAGKPIYVVFAVLGATDARALVEYRTGDLVKSVTGPNENGYSIIPGEDVHEGTFEYRIKATSGYRASSWPLEGFHSIPVLSGEDSSGPFPDDFAWVEPRVLGMRLKDRSGIAGARLHWYPLSDNEPLRWLSGEIDIREDGTARVEIPPYPCAILIETRDMKGNILYYPAGIGGQAYWVID